VANFPVTVMVVEDAVTTMVESTMTKTEENISPMKNAIKWRIDWELMPESVAG
jgi:hypothetical protein